MRVRDTLAKETKRKKGIIGTKQEETTMCSLIIRRILNAECVERQKQHESGVKKKPRSGWTELHLPQNSET